jgi:hypothetical protein
MKRRRPLSDLAVAALKAEFESGGHLAPSAPSFLTTIKFAFAAVFLFACHHAPTSISCPPGAKLMGAPPPKGSEVWCEKLIDSKPVKDGPFIVYATGGGKMIEGDYHNGVQEGKWTLWYENGARASTDHYINGLQSGLHTSWYANGQKALEGEYQDGKREGVWTRWDPNGLTSHQMVYKNGTLEK